MIKTILLHCTTEGLSVDWLSDKLYWGNGSHGVLEVLDLNSGYRKALTVPVTESVVVDPANRYID